jgi:ribosomal protein S18 acetylase RimI-like enzyme
MGEVEIHEALVSDASGIAKVHISTWRSAYQGIMPVEFLRDLSIETRTSGWAKILEAPAPKAHTYVAVLDKSIVGFIGVGSNQSEEAINCQGELFALYVEPDFQGRGIGGKLMEKGIEALRSERFTSASLWVAEENLLAKDWYESRHWELNGEFDQRSFGEKSVKSIGYSLKF